MGEDHGARFRVTPTGMVQGASGKDTVKDQAAEGMYVETHGLLLLLPTGSQITDSSPVSTTWKTFLILKHSLNEI